MTESTISSSITFDGLIVSLGPASKTARCSSLATLPVRTIWPSANSAPASVPAGSPPMTRPAGSSTWSMACTTPLEATRSASVTATIDAPDVIATPSLRSTATVVPSIISRSPAGRSAERVVPAATW